ncbi:Ww Domain-Binding Protein 11 [Manis pentadactyla]|nr:Ww Domain-Binding Protein 11 [Manis pentadactyla]
MKAGASYEREMVEALPSTSSTAGPWRPTEARTCPALGQSARRSSPLPSIGIQQNTNLVESFVISQFLEVAQQNAQPCMWP